MNWPIRTGREYSAPLGWNAYPSRTYSVYVDDPDRVWITEWTSNAIMRFDANLQKWSSFPGSKPDARVRQMLAPPGEAWGAESANDRLVVIRDD